MEEKKDRRLMERNYVRGDEKDLNAYLKSLPDETANAQWVEVELHDTELGADDVQGGGNSGNHGTP